MGELWHKGQFFKAQNNEKVSVGICLHIFKMSLFCRDTTVFVTLLFQIPSLAPVEIWGYQWRTQDFSQGGRACSMLSDHRPGGGGF